MFGKFVLKLFGGSKTRKVSRKKRGGKIVLANNNKNQNGGQCGARKLNQGGGQCGANKKNQNGGQCGANKKNQNGGSLRTEIPLQHQPGVILRHRPKPPSYAKQNAPHKPWTRPPKGLRKKSKKKSSNSPSKPNSNTPSKPKSNTPSKSKSKRRGKSFAARAASMKPGNKSLQIY